MAIPQIISLISSIFVFVLGIFVVSKNIKSKINILFGFFCFGTVFWLFGTYLMLSSKTDEAAMFWDRLIYIGGILTPVLIYHFGRVFLEREKKKTLDYLSWIYSCSNIFDSK